VQTGTEVRIALWNNRFNFGADPNTGIAGGIQSTLLANKIIQLIDYTDCILRLLTRSLSQVI